MQQPGSYAIAYSRDSRTCCTILWYKPILQAARQTTAGSIDFREVQIASNGSKSRHNSITKLRMTFLHIQKRDNVEFYLCCKFQLSPFSVRCKTDVKDGVTDWQTNELPYAMAPPLGITIMAKWSTGKLNSDPKWIWRKPNGVLHLKTA